MLGGVERRSRMRLFGSPKKPDHLAKSGAERDKEVSAVFFSPNLSLAGCDAPIATRVFTGRVACGDRDY